LGADDFLLSGWHLFLCQESLARRAKNFNKKAKNSLKKQQAG
jgi:hypothetical protein